MVRLTLPHYGEDGHYMKCSEGFGCDGKCGDCPELDQLVERLAAYEDTGLTPKQAADAAPVVHGWWRFCGEDRWNDAYVCSKCGKIAMDNSNYCPNCGAKMDEGKGEANERDFVSWKEQTRRVVLRLLY